MNNPSPTQHKSTLATQLVHFGWLLIGCAVLGITLLSGRWLTQELQLQTAWPDFNSLQQNLHLPASWWRWVIGDISEVAFYKHEFASLGLVAGAGLAYWAGLRGKRWAGFAICYGTGLWPWVLTSSLLGLLLSNLLWGWTLSEQEWQPTFVAFVSLPAAMVLVFGKGWRIAISGALMGALLVAPAALLIVNYLCRPLGLPLIIGNVLGMASASILAFLLCRWWPDLVRPRATSQNTAPRTSLAEVPDYGFFWTVRRVLADFSEAPFFGNELASLGLLLGVGMALVLNPESPAYGSGLLPELISGQFMAAMIGVLVWRRQWIKRGWYPTYIPLVSVVPAAILLHGGGVWVIGFSALTGALVAPPLATMIAARLPTDMHPYIANVLSMAVSTLLIVPLAGEIATLT